MAIVPLSRIALAAAGVSVLLAGCGPGLTNAAVSPPGSEMYQLGYVNGCPSGYVDAGRVGYESGSYVKDPKLYPSNPEYRQGWDQGHMACYEDERRYPKMGGPKEGRDHKNRP